MSAILRLGDSLIPTLHEVENPCLAARLNAIDIGSLELVMNAVGALNESISYHGDGPERLSLDDFKACLEYIPVFVDDPAMVLVSGHAAQFDTYAEATRWFDRLQKQPELAPKEQRADILMTFSSYLRRRYEQELENFHRRFKDYTVFVSEDGRIAVGRYE